MQEIVIALNMCHASLHKIIFQLDNFICFISLVDIVLFDIWFRGCHHRPLVKKLGWIGTT